MPQTHSGPFTDEKVTAAPVPINTNKHVACGGARQAHTTALYPHISPTQARRRVPSLRLRIQTLQFQGIQKR